MKSINTKGFTLLELIVSIFVSSIVISILIQMLTMSIQARNNVQVESRLKDESYYLVESLKWNIFELQTQSVSISETTSNITITFNHDYDINISSTAPYAIYEDTSAAESHTLVYNKDTDQIFYNGNRLHSSKVYFDDRTDFSIVSVDSTCDPTLVACNDVILTLTLWITIELEDGSRLDSKLFETTIII